MHHFQAWRAWCVVAALVLVLLPCPALAQDEPPGPEATDCEIEIDVELPPIFGMFGAGALEWLLESLIGQIAEGVRTFFCWLLDFSLLVFGPLFEYVGSLIPTDWLAYVGAFIGIASVVNTWVPADFVLGLHGIYWVFLLGFIIVKYILKLIPTIG